TQRSDRRRNALAAGHRRGDPGSLLSVVRDAWAHQQLHMCDSTLDRPNTPQSRDNTAGIGEAVWTAASLRPAPLAKPNLTGWMSRISLASSKTDLRKLTKIGT